MISVDRSLLFERGKLFLIPFDAAVILEPQTLLTRIYGEHILWKACTSRSTRLDSHRKTPHSLLWWHCGGLYSHHWWTAIYGSPFMYVPSSQAYPLIPLSCDTAFI